jgi:hypothetical protein
MKIQWPEVFKFLCGAAFAGALANLYLWLTGIPIPFGSFTITPMMFGIRAVLGLALFVLFLYLGWLRESTRHTRTPA